MRPRPVICITCAAQFLDVRGTSPWTYAFETLTQLLSMRSADHRALPCRSYVSASAAGRGCVHDPSDTHHGMGRCHHLDPACGSGAWPACLAAVWRERIPTSEQQVG